MKALSLNLIIAVIWLLLSQSPSPGVFAAGFIVGFVVVVFFRPVLGDEDYVRRSTAFLRFVAIFIREFVLANAKVAWMVLFRTRDSLHPNFITYDVTGLTRLEIILLSYCITLTPGTTTVQLTEDFRTLVLHALNAEDPDEIRSGIDRRLKRTILSFTR